MAALFPVRGALGASGTYTAVVVTFADGSPAMFDQIAGRYDLLNRLLSLGLDGAWRRAAVEAMGLRPGDRVLDVATGTADLALATMRRAPEARAVGMDPALEMLRRGLDKVREAGLRIPLAAGDAQRLPFADGVFAAASIAFGIRNVPDRIAGLVEMRRVVRPGGRVVVLELARPEGHLLAPLARWYVRWVVPVIGAAVSRGVAYRYLRDSMEAFPSPDDFLEQMERAGLREPRCKTLPPGACHLFTGLVPAS